MFAGILSVLLMENGGITLRDTITIRDLIGGKKRLHMDLMGVVNAKKPS